MGIRLDKLVVKFGDFKALNEVTLQIPKGKLVSLLGPSGSGKSTTLFTISGIHKPHSGKIYFGDRDVTGLEPEELGIVSIPKLCIISTYDCKGKYIISFKKLKVG